MIVELLVALTTLGSGVLTLRAAGLRGWGVVPLGHLVGTSLLTLVATVQAALSLPTSTPITLSVTLVGAAVAWAVARRRGRGLDLSLRVAAAVGTALVPVVWVFRAADLARVTPDSFNLIMSGSLLHRDLLELAPPDFLEDWQVTSGAIHAAANAQGEFYLRSAGPLLALATLAALVWSVERALGSLDLDRRSVVGVAFLSGALLLTTQRFLYNAFYLNRHVLIAGLLLVACVAAWGLVRGTIAPAPTLFVLLATVLPGLALGRAETPLVAGLVLLPVLASGAVPRNWRAALLVVLGGVVVLWNLSLVVRYAASDLPMSTSAVAMALLGLLVLVTAVLVLRGWPPLDPLPRWGLFGAEATLWLGVLGGAVLDLEVLRESVSSTVSNVVHGAGGWGASLLVLGMLVLLTAAATHEGDRVQLRLPLTAFVPLALLLTYVRADGGLPYRVGLGDSFNRMLLHFVPLAIFYVATASTAVGRRRGRGGSGPAHRPVAARPSTDLPPRTETP
jgi:hypothetical protein